MLVGWPEHGNHEMVIPIEEREKESVLERERERERESREEGDWVRERD